VPLPKAKALKPMEIINMDIVTRTAMEDEKSELLVGRQKKNRKRSKKIPWQELNQVSLLSRTDS
jgi:hypothetical protein